MITISGPKETINPTVAIALRAEMKKGSLSVERVLEGEPSPLIT